MVYHPSGSLVCAFGCTPSALPHTPCLSACVKHHVNLLLYRLDVSPVVALVQWSKLDISLANGNCLWLHLTNKSAAPLPRLALAYQQAQIVAQVTSLLGILVGAVVQPRFGIHGAGDCQEVGELTQHELLAARQHRVVSNKVWVHFGAAAVDELDARKLFFRLITLAVVIAAFVRLCVKCTKGLCTTLDAAHILQVRIFVLVEEPAAIWLHRWGHAAAPDTAAFDLVDVPWAKQDGTTAMAGKVRVLEAIRRTCFRELGVELPVLKVNAFLGQDWDGDAVPGRVAVCWWQSLHHNLLVNIKLVLLHPHVWDVDVIHNSRKPLSAVCLLFDANFERCGGHTAVVHWARLWLALGLWVRRRTPAPAAVAASPAASG